MAHAEDTYPVGNPTTDSELAAMRLDYLKALDHMLHRTQKRLREAKRQIRVLEEENTELRKPKD